MAVEVYQNYIQFVSETQSPINKLKQNTEEIKWLCSRILEWEDLDTCNKDIERLLKHSQEISESLEEDFKFLRRK